MRSYLDIITELKEAIKSDYAMPRFVRDRAFELLEKILDLLFAYSD